MLLNDVGVSPYGKLPKLLAEIFGRYGASDYCGVLAEYNRGRSGEALPRSPMPLHT